VRNVVLTRLPSNLRQTGRECVYLVRLGHVRSRDKDGITPFWFTIAKNATLHANFTAASSTRIEPNLIADHQSFALREFLAFFTPDSFTLTRWPSHSMLIENKLSTSRLSKVIVSHTDRQTYRQTDATKKHYHDASLMIIKHWRVNWSLVHCQCAYIAESSSAKFFDLLCGRDLRLKLSPLIASQSAQIIASLWYSTPLHCWGELLPQ